ncbi:type II toxin-antitoxin system RelE/ParE family toxin [Stenomitos frigidus]|uniref:Type II toxin-antitoxin system RelE/ParE family toxin n=1 Tax=Stenomitos frigidus ULC18 TaxID=2107698 RepID=A0A2T1E1P6_9CYAN|nr:type II toxin-antitoxin system RelE/ParE family toxin [Stenomitos frigidus]PSB26631.1 type II toxin-antitoxin system RelE/ParE family toxin [Stenomitos frigidus ULC18]
MKKQVMLPTAIADVDREAFGIAEYAGQDAGLRFYAACDDTFVRLATDPDIGKVWPFEHPKLANLRAWQVKEFSDYLVFDRSLRDQVEILKVINGSRDLEPFSVINLGRERDLDV